MFFITRFPAISIRPLKIVSKKKHFHDRKKNCFRFIVYNSGNTRVPTSLQKTATKRGSRKRIRADRTISNKKKV